MPTDWENYCARTCVVAMSSDLPTAYKEACRQAFRFDRRPLLRRRQGIWEVCT